MGPAAESGRLAGHQPAGAAALGGNGAADAAGSGPRRSTVAVRPATAADLARTASWQAAFLPYGLFPKLGGRFVRRWHATFLDSPFGVALVAGQEGPGGRVPVGFLVGSTDQEAHVDEVIRRHRASLAAAGLAALLLRPRLCAHFLRTRGKAYFRRLLTHPDAAARRGSPGDATRVPGAAGLAGTAVVTAVAVVPEARSCGAGRDLLGFFLAQSQAAGAGRAELAVMAGPGSAEAFYDRLGWVPVDEHLSRDGSRVLTYRYTLEAAAAG
ncbi:GNAT family N-acetyltransferase [Arthrobacter deserti]|uniref:GNAT family N-acetyltransferase n=1 Tax=Arthrobacter deserti TaxID=1742687 RepID=A0ABX1JMI4_9MICC|nr:GNAT family N-acetyltransferase [Arthrobacter deserti]